MILLIHTNNKGFIAFVSLLTLVLGALAFSIGLLSAVFLYSDSVNRKEMRFQAKLNARACLDVMGLMYAKNFFLQGTVELKEFGCVAEVFNDFDGHASTTLRSSIEGVAVFESGYL